MEILCGEYNAKNRMGGFTGFKMFMFEPAELSGVVSIDLPLGLDFFSLDGRDARQDTRGNYAQGDSVAEEHARYQIASNYAIDYAGFCLS
ncbi:hypothetical protein [Novosphingobium sp. JCM 18896]|uniref:hypothetical protein n=1 Tax=Novosphingobium sp. JCM 18896 TaxID=2989731 RepID=UPI002222037D|nr:hypothetical protein [Novosphingobium sp. JCM 18896]MCW1432479.1 hypothetical protein [Novosphingobium sp. JCM 18896]